MKLLTKLLFVLILVGAGVVGFAFSGIYDASATSKHSRVVHWLLSTAARKSIERRAQHITVPDLNNDALKLAGINDYNSMCVGCHGAPGLEAEAVGKGLYPTAPDLSESATQMTPAELFWVAQNGIKNTGMPAWGATHDAEALWPVVSFLVVLPELSAEDYQSMLVQAAGSGHHASGVSQTHDETQQGETSAAHTHGNDQHPEGSGAGPVQGEFPAHDAAVPAVPAETPDEETHDDHRH